MAPTTLAHFDWPSFRPPLEKYKLDYGIGIVGYAGIIRAQQLPAYRLAGFRVAAASDTRPERRDLAVRDGIPHVYDDYRALLQRDDVDIIDCAVDHSRMPERVEILESAAKAGKAVLMQKPMALDLATAERMVRIAADHGIPYAVNQNLRFDPAIYAAKQFLTAERFGAPGFLHVANISVEGPAFSQGANGVVMAWQIHAIDSIRWLAGGEATSAMCTNRNNAALYQIEFSSGAVCNYFEYHNAANFRNETPLRIWAEKGAVRGNHRWNPGSRWERELLEVRGYDWPEAVDWVSYKLPDDQTPRNVYIGACYDHSASIGGFIGCMGEFMQSIYEKRPALTDGSDNLRSLRIYFAGQESAARRCPVDPRSMDTAVAGA
jgi:predicted dehydrogenase